MERYLILDHAGDAKIRAFGTTAGEAFGNAALALASLMWDWSRVERLRAFPVAVEGGDLGQLLYKFLEEILYRLDADRFLLAGVEDLRIEGGAEPGFRLTARLLGDDDLSRYDFHGGVKAVTYNDMKIESGLCGPAPWMVQAVVDM